MITEKDGDKPVPEEVISADEEIVLKKFSPDDAQEIFELINRNRAHLSQFGDETASKYPTLESVLASIESPKNPNRLRFAVKNKEEVLVGSISLTPDEDDPTRGEIGYYLGQEFTGQGYTQKALQLLTEYALSFWGYQTLYGDVHPENIASIKVLEKAGFIPDGHDGDDLRLSKHK